MNRLADIPLVKLILPFMGGIFLYLATMHHLPAIVYLSSYLVLATIWFFRRRIFLSNFAQRWIFGLLTSLFLLLAGYNIAQNFNQLEREAHFSRFQDKGGHLILRVSEQVSEKANSFQVISRAIRVIYPDGAMAVQGRLMLYLQKDSLAAVIRYGDLLLIENSFQEISTPKNPHEFNYKRFLANKNIYHQTYRASGYWQFLGLNEGFFLKRWSLGLHQRALQTFRDNNISGEEFAVVSALLLGFTDYLDEDLKQEYAGSGAMHLLSVSGLHVGIIFVAIKFLLSFLKRYRHGRYIQTFLTVVLIWFYAAITGFSPSVLRASTMFSFIAIAQSIKRKTDIYNNLAASAFFLLIVDPYILTQIGFQLSYLAVISIVGLQPYFYQKLHFKNFVLDKGWSIITVSIAAQLATGPLALFYFNQFPNYFLITSLVVIPLSTIIIYSSIVTLAISAIPGAGYLAGKVVSGLVYAMNGSVRFFEGLPYSTLTNVHITLPETIAIFATIILLALFFIRKFKPAFLLAMATILFLAASTSFRSIQNNEKRVFVVYHVNNATAIDFFYGKQHVMLMCDELESRLPRAGFHFEANRIRNGAAGNLVHLNISEDNTVQKAGWQRSGPFIRFGKTTIFILNPATPREFPEPGFDIQYLFVCQNARHNPGMVIEKLRPAKIVLDASNNRWTLQNWKDASINAGIQYWLVPESGAYMAYIK
ncbi:MAG TPA: ComEC/Rec2 family competence protein [Bacteroidales bacterium]|nr:ComEC/Rec2 family competence protein [Bacteroidales bacterium]